MPQHTPSTHKEQPGRRSGPQAGRSTRSGKTITFIDILKNEHDQVKDLFNNIQDPDNESREDVLMEIDSSLKMHMQKEERFLYPVLKQSDEASILSGRSLEEHREVRGMLAEFEDLSPETGEWEDKILVLKQMITDHVAHEENELFPLALREMNADQIKNITQSMLDFG